MMLKTPILTVFIPLFIVSSATLYADTIVESLIQYAVAQQQLSRIFIGQIKANTIIDKLNTELLNISKDFGKFKEIYEKTVAASDAIKNIPASTNLSAIRLSVGFTSKSENLNNSIENIKTTASKLASTFDERKVELKNTIKKHLKTLTEQLKNLFTETTDQYSDALLEKIKSLKEHAVLTKEKPTTTDNVSFNKILEDFKKILTDALNAKKGLAIKKSLNISSTNEENLSALGIIIAHADTKRDLLKDANTYRKNNESKSLIETLEKIENEIDEKFLTDAKGQLERFKEALDKEIKSLRTEKTKTAVLSRLVELAALSRNVEIAALFKKIDLEQVSNKIDSQTASDLKHQITSTERIRQYLEGSEYDRSKFNAEMGKIGSGRLDTKISTIFKKFGTEGTEREAFTGETAEEMLKKKSGESSTIDPDELTGEWKA